MPKPKNDGDFVAVYNSCVEGYTGEWDCSTEEGRKGFLDMTDLLRRVAKRHNIDLSKAKSIEEEG